MRLSVSRDRLTRHFQYDWWKYVIAVGGTLLALNLLFTMLIGDVPAHLKVDIYMAYEGSPPDQEQLIILGASILEGMPDQEKVNVEAIPITERTAAIPYDKLYVQLSAKIGNVYIMSRSYFNEYAKMGAFMGLSEAIDEGLVNIDGMTPMYVTQDDEAKTRDIYGIDLSDFKYFGEIGYDESNPVICVLRDSPNLEHVFQSLEWMFENLNETGQP